jgi:hypothetical protein
MSFYPAFPLLQMSPNWHYIFPELFVPPTLVVLLSKLFMAGYQ